MDIEKEQLKLKLIEAQMMILQYQHKEVAANLETITKATNEQLPATS